MIICAIIYILGMSKYNYKLGNTMPLVYEKTWRSIVALHNPNELICLLVRKGSGLAPYPCENENEMSVM